ncbi:MAG: penicillin-binding protein 2 [Nocardioides sp.]
MVSGADPPGGGLMAVRDLAPPARRPAATGTNAGGRSNAGSELRTRLRLMAILAIALTMFSTLLARLYYVQIVEGDRYRARAESQSIRDVVVQPERGLIVDAMGRPLVANRTAWTVSVDRALLDRLNRADRSELLERVARAVDSPRRRVSASLVDCGSEGARRERCWKGSAYQPVPIATDVSQDTALRILEQPEDFPSVVVEQSTARSFPAPYGVNGAHVLGYLSPVTRSELGAARAEDDNSLNGASLVGRAGIERRYDAWLRGVPGYRRIMVDSMGRPIEDSRAVRSTPGATLVTSLDARVQGLAERQLAEAIRVARGTRDKATGRNFVADSGAVVVMEARTGRLVAMASQPTYDPGVWVGGIRQGELDRLYSEQAGTPLLSRATQGQFAPGSTWKPFMTAAALAHGYGPDSRLNCSSSVRVGNREFRNYESGAYGYIDFKQALEVSCNTFFYRVGYDYWRRWGSDAADVTAKDPMVAEAKRFGFGAETGVDLPGEAAGRIADRRWKRAYYEARKSYYCEAAERAAREERGDFQARFAREFCLEGYAYRAGDAANFSIGQGDTVVTPLQLARAYAALANGGTLYAPQLAKAVVGPEGDVLAEFAPRAQRNLRLPARTRDYIDDALQGVSRRGTLAWRMGGFPLDEVTVRAKTGSAEVYGKQSTSWVASYTEDYVVVMMVSQGGTGSGTSGPAVRKLWEGLYGVRGDRVRPARSLIPGVVTTPALPTFAEDGSILPPVLAAERGRS